jgi:hypothetical protein
MTLHDTTYELDTPTLISPRESPTVPRAAGKVGGWLGVRYVRLHVAGASNSRPDVTPHPRAAVRALDRAA